MSEGRAGTCVDNDCAIIMSGPHWHPPGRAAELVAGQEATGQRPVPLPPKPPKLVREPLGSHVEGCSGRRATAAEGLRADIEKEKAREDRDAWSRGFVYGMQHALRMIEAEDA